jgi:methylisocitrate lyase
MTPGETLRDAVRSERPLQVVGAVNAFSAMLAERSGFRALYVSGAGVANASYGLPDLGMTSLDNVAEDVRRITSVTALPVLVDIDTGFGGALNIGRTIKEMIRAGAAGVHIEDQVQAKRCGHRPGKALVSQDEMVDRVKACVDARTDPSFVIMARSDAFAVEGLEAAVSRANACKAAGADMIFPEAVSELAHYRRFADTVGLPILANITEFGKTPLFNVEQLREAGVSLALYPLSAFRAMSKAALAVYDTIRRDGSQQAAVPAMQTRAELYDVLGYHHFEQTLDRLFDKGTKHE